MSDDEMMSMTSLSMRDNHSDDDGKSMLSESSSSRKKKKQDRERLALGTKEKQMSRDQGGDGIRGFVKKKSRKKTKQEKESTETVLGLHRDVVEDKLDRYTNKKYTMTFAIKKMCDQPLGLSIFPTGAEAVIPGVFVADVDVDGPCHDHIEPGDHLMSINNHATTGMSFQDVRSLCKDAAIQDVVNVTIVRAEIIESIALTYMEGDTLGLEVKNGIIDLIVPRSVSHQAGLRAGYRIFEVDGHYTGSSSDRDLRKRLCSFGTKKVRVLPTLLARRGAKHANSHAMSSSKSPKLVKKKQRASTSSSRRSSGLTGGNEDEDSDQEQDLLGLSSYGGSSVGSSSSQGDGKGKHSRKKKKNNRRHSERKRGNSSDDDSDDDSDSSYVSADELDEEAKTVSLFTDRSNFETVSIVPQKGKLGFSVLPTGMNALLPGVFVTSVERGSSADGTVQIGDQILSIEGQSLIGMHFDHMVKILQKCAKSGSLVMQLIHAQIVTTVEVHMHQGESLGFFVQDAIVHGLTPNCKVAEAGLQNGARIFEVNGVNIPPGVNDKATMKLLSISGRLIIRSVKTSLCSK